MEKEDLDYFRKSFKNKLEYKYISLTHHKIFEEIENVILFVGYPRSSHSLIGAILDAHPHIVISHELDVLPLFNQNIEIKKIFSWILQTSRKFRRKKCKWTGYDYLINGQYQGKFKDRIHSIGDKKGGATAYYLAKNPNLINDVLKKIPGKKLKLIHVIRNPFDNITTMAKGGNNRMHEVSRNNLIESIKEYFEFVKVVEKLKKQPGLEIYDLYNEEFIENPKREIGKLMDFLGQDFCESYLNDTSSIVFSKKKKTFNQEDWPKDLFDIVNVEILSSTFLSRYFRQHYI